ncbi:uncharacterized protein KRP23_188 [Phytophthora ramorum]|nr:hypothetical protein KRP23_188 [Phytophthora ramorum]
MVSTQISVSELEAGEAIFREQIRGIVEVETIDRVQLEYLQTDVPSEDEQGTYYVALGISALPPPLGSSGNSYASTDSSLVLPTIEIERERIVEKVRYGSILASGNVTIDSLSLFGGQMSLVDITLDGEALTQVYLKPWVGVQLVIASTTSETTGVSTSDGDHYTTDRNAFQDLRLRFLLARRLRSVQVGVSDIIVHSPVALLPFDIFHADAGVLEIEIHVHDIQYADVVESILIDDGSTPNATASNNLAATFNEMESQWQLIAMDVDTVAGELFSPAGGSSTSLATDNGDSGFVSELAFEMRNISMAQLERTKWSVLDFIRIEAAQITSGRVRFGHIVFPPSSYALSNLDIHNDGSDAGSIFDPINAINWTLNFLVESENSDSADLASHITDTQTFVEMGFQHALGFTADSSNFRSTTFKGAIDWVDPGWANADSVEPFVSFTLTIQLEPLGASGIILESPNFFQLHYVRCALVLLLQQVAIADNQVALISANAVDLPTVKLDKTGHTWHRLLFFKYRATISDESQRRGIRSVIFSHRLAATISHYSGSTLELVEREIDLHADGSPVWPKYLPGLLVAAPTANSTSDGFTTSSASQLGHQESFTYDFSDPQPNIASGILADATGLCPSTTSINTSALCIKLHFTGSFQVAPIYLRTLHSLRPIESSTISLPPQHAALDAADSSTSYPAPWVLVGEQTVDEKTSWALQVGASPDAKTYSIRLTFAAVDTMQDLSATTPFTLDLEFNAEDVAVSPVVRRRQFGDLAVVSTIGQPAPAFITAEPPELVGDGTQTSVHITMDLQKPRLGGLYSVSLLNDVAPSCRDCTTAMTDCNSILECRAFSACASVLLDADLTLISTMLQTDATVISVDASWLLRDCLSPSDGTVWSSTVREMLLSSYTCLLGNHCPLAYSVSVGKQLVLDYQHGEQVLTFELASGFASLSFMLDTDEDDSTTYEFVEDFSANATDVTTQLNAMLTEMYRAALSNVATVESVLTTLEDPATGAVTAHLTLKYLFLGQLPLPFVHISKSGSTDATVETTVPNETLHLRAIPINP